MRAELYIWTIGTVPPHFTLNYTTRALMLAEGLRKAHEFSEE
jgi:hypothetical protein